MESFLEKPIEHVENFAVKAIVSIPDSFQRFHNMCFIYLGGRHSSTISICINFIEKN